MKFGAILSSSQHPPWSAHYIDYTHLKNLIYVLFDRQNELETSFQSADGSLVSPRLGTYYGSYNIGNSLTTTHSGVFVDDHPPSLLHSTVTVDGEALPLLDDNPSTEHAMTSRDFQRELNAQIQKAVLFIIQTMGELASELNGLLAHQKNLAVGIQPLLALSSSIDESKREYVEDRCKEIFDLRMELLVRIGNKLLLLLEFVELNVEAVTKIVKKHDKLFAQWEQHSNQVRKRSSSISLSYQESERYERLRRQYLPRFARFSSDPNIRCLFLLAADAGDCFCGMNGGESNNTSRNKESDGNFGGWDVMQWNLERALRELFEWTQALKSSYSADSKESSIENERTEVMEKAVLMKTRSKSMSSTQAHDNLYLHKRRSRSGSRSSFLGLNSLTESMTRLVSLEDSLKTTGSFFEPLLYRIQYIRRRLGQTTDRYARMVYAHEMLHIIDDRHLREEDDKYLMQTSKGKELEGDGEANWMDDGVSMVSELSKFLNLMSSGLYMCNYNIVAPTSGLYAKLLGFNPANAGIIIGMTPLAVIGSSVLYSWWSSYSYKHALLFASFCCIVGNTVYALALPCDSLPMVLIGRMLIGFGSCRVINRRYIADYYSVQTRTAGMAQFVSAGAFGMAIGPALAASFSLIAPHGHVMNHPSVSASWTVETVPGWFMAVIWALYFGLSYIYFEEPDRIRSHPDDPVPSKLELENTGDHSPLTLEAQQTSIRPPPLRWSYCNVPVLISLMLLVLLKSILEGLTSSTPTVGRYYFGWNSHSSGIFLAVMASLVLPVNYLVANVSRRYDDREMIVATLGVMLAGILGFLVYSIDYSETRYVCSSFVIFCSCNAIEAPTMGLLSKTIPKAMASGILNAGLLATEAGTVGRVIGDFYFSAAAFEGFDRVVNLTFEPMAFMVAVSIGLVAYHYRKLQPRYEDEEDED